MREITFGIHDLSVQAYPSISCHLVFIVFIFSGCGLIFKNRPISSKAAKAGVSVISIIFPVSKISYHTSLFFRDQSFGLVENIIETFWFACRTSDRIHTVNFLELLFREEGYSGQYWPLPWLRLVKCQKLIFSFLRLLFGWLLSLK